jgi:hypothetical protein
MLGASFLVGARTPAVGYIKGYTLPALALVPGQLSAERN